MTTVEISGAPACARRVWCDHSSLYLEIPHISGGPPYIMKLPRDSIGFQKALEILLDAHNAIAPKGGHYNLTRHPATKVVGMPNKVAHDILKKLRMI